MRWFDFPVSSLALAASLGAACAVDAPESGRLELAQLDDSTVAGSLVNDDDVRVEFESSSRDQRVVELHLEVDGASMDFTYDSQGILTEDGRQTVLRPVELAALLDLRDAVNREIPEVVQKTLQGRFLSRHADWLADAPTGYAVDTRIVDVQDRIAARQAKSTADDDEDTTCLRSGRRYTAWFDGADGTIWTWTRVANSGGCLGRCGAGCNIFDHDLMLDCFEHDSCIDHLGGSLGPTSADCGDEFGHAVVEYLVTFGSWCP